MKIPICMCGDPRADHRGALGTGSCTSPRCGCPYFAFSHFIPGPASAPVCECHGVEDCPSAHPPTHDPRIPGFAFTVLNGDPDHAADPDD